MKMANQTGFEMFVNKLKQQIGIGQRPARTKRPAHNPPEENGTEVYAGPLLEIGNELLITAEIVQAYGNLSNAFGRVVIIDQIVAKEGKAIKASAFGIQVAVSMTAAGQMRAAYLRREDAWS